jgi:hypothetical protein
LGSFAAGGAVFAGAAGNRTSNRHADVG